MDIPKEYIRKYWFGINQVQELAEVVLLMERDRIEQYKAALDITTNHFQGVFKGVTGILNNRRISIIYSIGPAHIVDCVNFLAYGFPLQKLFVTGSIGGLNTEMGDIIISNTCSTQDGYTLTMFHQKIHKNQQFGHYVDIDNSCSFKVSQEVAKKIKTDFDCKIKCGRIFTIPCVSMEDYATLVAIKSQEYIALDLETGPFLSACKVNKIEGICIHWVTDLPLQRDFYYQYHGDPKKIQQDKTKKHKQWLNMPKIILPILNDFLLSK